MSIWHSDENYLIVDDLDKILEKCLRYDIKKTTDMCGLTGKYILPYKYSHQTFRHKKNVDIPAKFKVLRKECN